MGTSKFTFLFNIFKRKTSFVLAALFLIYHSLFNVYTAEKLSSWLFPKFIQGEYRLQWEKFSLFYGIEISNLEIKGSQNFSEDRVLKAEAIKFRYNLPLLFLGRLKISDISLIKPELYLRESGGIWNISTCFVPGEQTKEEEKETDKLEEISTYLPVSGFVNLQIVEPQVQVVEESKPSRLKIVGPSLYLVLDTLRFRTIPLNSKILELPEILTLSVNPEKRLALEYETSKLKILAPLDFELNVQKEVGKKDVYSSRLRFSGNKIPLETKPNQFTYLDFYLGYNIGFKEQEDVLELSEFVFQIGTEKWFDITGKINHLSTNNPNFELNALPSSVQLNNLNEIYSKLPDLPYHRFSGTINIEEINAKGDLKEIQSNIKINAKDLVYKNSQKTYSVPKFLLDVKAKLDLAQEEKSHPSIPFISEIKINPLALNLNGANLYLESDIHSKNVTANLKIDNFLLQEFVKAIGGKISANLKVQGENLSALNVGLDLSYSGFSLLTSGFKTNPGNLLGRLNGNIQLQNNFQVKNIDVQMLSLRLFNPAGQEAISLNTGASIPGFSPFSLRLQKFFLQLRLRKILPLLQYSLMEKISPLREILGEDIMLKSNISLDFQKGIKIQGNLSPIIPNLQINDFIINLNTTIDSDGNGSIAIPQFQIQGFSKAFNGSFSGNLIKPRGEEGPLGGFIPKANLSLSLKSAEFIPLSPKFQFQGNLGTDLLFNGSKITGSLFSENTNLNFKIGNCDGGNCKRFELQKIQTNVPIDHDLKISTTESILSGDKSKFMRTYGQEMTPNFSIHRLIGTHPFLENQDLEYIKPNDNIPGLRGRIDYVRNVFSLNQLKINTLNGFIYGKDILFNLKSGLPQNMEYSAVLQIREMDLKELLHPRSAKKIDDGKIISDLNVSGFNILDPIQNLNLYFSIYKIGKDFGKSAINIVMSSNYIQDYIVSSYSVDRIEVELSRGLVYANILFRPGLLPTLLTRIEDNKITQERMPLANFLNRAQSEITTYK